ncbi:carbonic anhydrase [Natranaerobius trueperi]|uniref:Carbonic anhydrase n=1 Tax=Natranaerobius trueperi TaxID=759412 RepID=A0A226BXV8_9FIRM|nr:carbonic anhydrase [Natranaerobius trueperi]OWZ83761.1 hypothetical protein CDO51_06615 [Natranaerobius trueperi]
MNKFVTAINCIDGRVQEAVLKKLKEEYKANYVDMITEPGPNRILSENVDYNTIESIKSRVNLSINKHASNLIAIIGHYDCANNLKDKDGQVLDIIESIKLINSWNFNVKVIGIWVDHNWVANHVI